MCWVQATGDRHDATRLAMTAGRKYLGEPQLVIASEAKQSLGRECVGFRRPEIATTLKLLAMTADRKSLGEPQLVIASEAKQSPGRERVGLRRPEIATALRASR
jgi:hypothetical protein